MKKILFVIIPIVLLSACGGTEEAEQNTESAVDTAAVIEIENTTHEVDEGLNELENSMNELNNDIDSLLNGI